MCAGVRKCFLSGCGKSGKKKLLIKVQQDPDFFWRLVSEAAGVSRAGVQSLLPTFPTAHWRLQLSDRTRLSVDLGQRASEVTAVSCELSAITHKKGILVQYIAKTGSGYLHRDRLSLEAPPSLITSGPENSIKEHPGIRGGGGRGYKSKTEVLH